MKRTFSVSRRGFLRSLLTTAAAVAVAGPTVFTAPAGGWAQPAPRLEFHPDSFNLAMLNPKDFVLVSPRENLGMSMRFIKSYEVQSDRFPARMDILYGMSVLQPGLAARITGVTVEGA